MINNQVTPIISAYKISETTISIYFDPIYLDNSQLENFKLIATKQTMFSVFSITTSKSAINFLVLHCILLILDVFSCELSILR